MTPLNDSSDPVLRYFRSHSYKQFQPRPWPGALPSVHWIPECIWPTVTTGQGLKRKRASNRNTFHFSPGIKGYLGPLHYGVRVTFFISALCHIHSFCHHLDRFLLRPEGLQGCLDFFFLSFSLSLFSRRRLHYNYSFINSLVSALVLVYFHTVTHLSHFASVSTHRQF